MKILTLNTHSLQEENYQQKLDLFVEGIIREMPDVIALQEVNQSLDAAEIGPRMMVDQYPMPGFIRIREDNHAAQIAYRLRQKGIECSWTWIPIKVGFGKYDEGVAVFSLGRKIRNAESFPISRIQDYNNWRTRAVLGVQLEGLDDWFYSVHMGWWDDEVEGFWNQWQTLECCLFRKEMYAPIWLLGDFNTSDQIRGEGYDAVASGGWEDIYRLADVKDDGITVPGVIDGWRERLADQDVTGMRLDYIWCSRKQKVQSCRVMFSGVKEPVVSDHFGVLAEIKE